MPESLCSGRRAAIVRALCVLCVVFYDWLATAVVSQDTGHLIEQNPLPALLPWSWLLLPIAVVFLVAGRVSRRAWPQPPWRRLARPMLAYALTWTLALLGLTLAGTAPETLGTLCWLAATPLPLLAAYTALPQPSLPDATPPLPGRTLTAWLNRHGSPILLWHQTALLVTTVAVLGIGWRPPGLVTTPDSPLWLMERLLWLPVFGLVTALLLVASPSGEGTHPNPARRTNHQPGGTVHAISVEVITALYAKYQDDLRAVRDTQREFLRRAGRSTKAQLDDVEAEITYLLLRDRRPEAVVEIGTFYGWSTQWILSALRDNGFGHLYSFDISDNAVRHVPTDLSADRWTFTQGDVRAHLDAIPAVVDYLFIDADHGARFARWYLTHLFPRIPAGTPTSVHDVFHGRRPKPWSEGSVVLHWLADHHVPYVTPSPARAPQVSAELARVKADLGLTEPVRTSHHNPMIFFTRP